MLDLVHVWSALLCYLRYTYDRRWKDFEDGRSHKVSDGSSQVTATTRSTAMGTDGASAAWKEEKLRVFDYVPKEIEYLLLAGNQILRSSTANTPGTSRQ